MALKRAVFLFRLAQMSSGIRSRSWHGLERPLTMQCSCIIWLHPYPFHFSTEDGGTFCKVLGAIDETAWCCNQDVPLEIFVSPFSVFQTFWYSDQFIFHFTTWSTREDQLLSIVAIPMIAFSGFDVRASWNSGGDNSAWLSAAFCACMTEFCCAMEETLTKAVSCVFIYIRSCLHPLQARHCSFQVLRPVLNWLSPVFQIVLLLHLNRGICLAVA